MDSSDNLESVDMIERLESYGWQLAFNHHCVTAVRMSYDGDTMMVQTRFRGGSDDPLKRLFSKVSIINQFFAV